MPPTRLPSLSLHRVIPGWLPSVASHGARRSANCRCFQTPSRQHTDDAVLPQVPGPGLCRCAAPRSARWQAHSAHLHCALSVSQAARRLTHAQRAAATLPARAARGSSARRAKILLTSRVCVSHSFPHRRPGVRRLPGRLHWLEPVDNQRKDIVHVHRLPHWSASGRARCAEPRCPDGKQPYLLRKRLLPSPPRSGLVHQLRNLHQPPGQYRENPPSPFPANR